MHLRHPSSSQPFRNRPLRTAWTALCDLFLPRNCIVCGRQLGVHERDLCLYCRADLPLTHYWDLSHNPMADRFNLLIQKDIEAADDAGAAEAPGLKDAAGAPLRHEPYAYAVALFFYHSDAGYRKIPQALKYHAAIDAGMRFGRLLGRKIDSSPYLRDIDAVIPVPLHWRRKWHRGYNQAEVIAREIAGALGVRMLSRILSRERPTRTQTRLSVEAKARNVAGAFRLRPGAPALFARLTAGEPGRRAPHLLLVDDVFTTGATLHACYRVIREAFPDAHISIATLAVVGH